MTDDFQIFRVPFLALKLDETKTFQFLHFQFASFGLGPPGLDISIHFLDKSFSMTPPQLVFLHKLTFLDGTIKDEISHGAPTF
jgi:hypothetical protein